MNTIQKLEALGLTHWIKGDMDRIYIDDKDLKAVFGLEIEYYKTGNIKSAILNGDKLSNNKAYGLLRNRIYFDCKINKFNTVLECIL